MDRKTDKVLPKTREIGEVKFKVRDILENARTQVLKLPLADGDNKSKGQIMLSNCSLRNSFSFIDLVFKNNINLVPVVAVDFSLANLTFDENQYCIHTLKSGAPNDYLDCLKRISSTY